MHEKHVIVTCDFRRPLDDDPMLGAMKMLLQRKPCPGLHHDALDLVARPGIDRLIIPPRAVGALMLHDLAAVFAAQPVTSCLTLSPCALLSTSTASWVVTTTTSSTPTT